MFGDRCVGGFWEEIRFCLATHWFFCTWCRLGTVHGDKNLQFSAVPALLERGD